MKEYLAHIKVKGDVYIRLYAHDLSTANAKLDERMDDIRTGELEDVIMQVSDLTYEGKGVHYEY